MGQVGQPSDHNHCLKDKAFSSVAWIGESVLKSKNASCHQNDFKEKNVCLGETHNLFSEEEEEEDKKS